ncbi:tetratricopeptide repeat protein [Tumebacillus permanentifrigoris]|uniref:DNA-binding XRE family transcriptional regulator n=1 Tax=Tumebacillus permanentifrigoris TaxID=378543 RepID=A0A316D9H4_9BACL|nr:tetratricopeptide repeat protein [Tumebacillus permanentifrigoris]PWK13825.1 DNA-binding XRE family transcriptional regulator [Tumebacillus permanentifrigoris]
MPATLGQKIKELRIQKGLTQSDLGAGMVTPSMISQIEADKANPSHKLLQAIAEKLETPIEYFLTDMQMQIEQIATYKVARSMMEAGEFERAVPILAGLMEDSVPQLHSAEIQFDLAECLLEQGKLDDALDGFDKVLSSATTRKDLYMQSLALKQLGYVEEKRHNYPLAIYHWQKALDLIAKVDDHDPFLAAEILRQLGKVYGYLGEKNDALTSYERAHKYIEPTASFQKIADLYRRLGETFREQGEFDRASEYAQHSISLYRGLKNIKLAIEVKENFGITKGEDGNAEEALQTLASCLSEYQEYGYIEKVAHTHGEMARIHLANKDYEQASAHCDEALKLLAEDSLERGFVYRTYSTIRKEQKKFSEAVDFMEQSVKVFEIADLPREIAKSYSMLGDIYKEQGDLQKAIHSLEQMKRAMESNLKERGIVL